MLVEFPLNHPTVVIVHSPDGEEEAGVARNAFPLGGCEQLPTVHIIAY